MQNLPVEVREILGAMRAKEILRTKVLKYRKKKRERKYTEESLQLMNQQATKSLWKKAKDWINNCF